jgi:hypothetical protein
MEEQQVWSYHGLRLTRTRMEEVQRLFQDYANCTLTLEQVDELLKAAGKDLIRDLVDIPPHLDSLCRDATMDLLSVQLTGRKWPTFGEEGVYDAWQTKFDDEARKRGYHVGADLSVKDC